jgi:16S rRNA (cytidine1402-2'-O)-methyltransferase
MGLIFKILSFQIIIFMIKFILYAFKGFYINRDSQTQGTLYIVSTPIGNLEDITLRALRVLKEVDFVISEDTRKAKRLLNYFKIPQRYLSYFSYNESKRIPQIIKKINSGENGALISEAGTPLISDPGHKLVMAALQNNISIVPIPGASAILAALVGSGFPTNRFVFEGFLPRKKGRQTRLKFLSEETGTIIIFESAVRIQKTIEDIVKIFGNRYIVLARELTKVFEEFIRGYAEDILPLVENKHLKGEIVLLIGGRSFQPDYLNT